MQVTVLFFGVLKDLAGRATDTLALPDSATVSDLLAHCESQFPRMKTYLPAIATSVNQEYAARAVQLHDRDEVALLPPVSGGSGTPGLETPNALLTREPLNPQELSESIRRQEDGAVVVFEGVVRNHSRGRRTLFLEYEAYDTMAQNELARLVAEATRKFDIRDARILHRLGRLGIGETSVLIAVASAHRAAAFDACRWLIDTLKHTVPIWKKEHFADGAVWADGEPFPDDLTGPNERGGASI